MRSDTSLTHACVMVRRRDPYATVRIPTELALEMDSFLPKSRMGFRSRAELALAAIREWLRPHMLGPTKGALETCDDCGQDTIKFLLSAGPMRMSTSYGHDRACPVSEYVFQEIVEAYGWRRDGKTWVMEM